MKHSTTKTSRNTEDGSVISDIVIDNGDYGQKSIRNYRIRVKVLNAQEEMTEYIRFTKELAELRDRKNLTVDKDDPSTHPAFIIHYPKEDIDGSYFVVKSYTVFI